MKLAREAFLENPPIILNSMEEIRRLLLSTDRNYVFNGISYAYQLLNYRDQVYCSLTAVERTRQSAEPAFLLFNNQASKHAKLISHAIIMNEKFIRNRVRFYYDIDWRHSFCNSNHGSSFSWHSLEMADLNGTFGLFLLSSYLSVFIFLLELCSYKFITKLTLCFHFSSSCQVCYTTNEK